MNCYCLWHKGCSQHWKLDHDDDDDDALKYKFCRDYFLRIAFAFLYVFPWNVTVKM